MTDRRPIASIDRSTTDRRPMPPIDRSTTDATDATDRSTTRASRRVARRDARLASSSMRGRTRSSATTEDAGTHSSARASDADDAPRSSSTDGARGRGRARSRLRDDSRTTARALTAHRSRVVALERDGACGCANAQSTDGRSSAIARRRGSVLDLSRRRHRGTGGARLRAGDTTTRAGGARSRSRFFTFFAPFWENICVGCLMSHDSWEMGPHTMARTTDPRRAIRSCIIRARARDGRTRSAWRGGSYSARGNRRS